MLRSGVVVQASTLPFRMFADHRGAQVGAVLATVLLRHAVAVVPAASARRIASAFSASQSASARRVVPVGTRVLAPMIEEADVVVLALERLDLAFDELVQHGQVAGQIAWAVRIACRLACRSLDRSGGSGRSAERAEFLPGCALENPPSTMKVWPFTYEPSLLARNATIAAISSGWPTRFSGLNCPACARCRAPSPHRTGNFGAVGLDQAGRDRVDAHAGAR